MLTWVEILKFANGHRELKIDRKVQKTELEWKKLLTPEQFQITRLKGTERPFSNAMCSSFEPGKYACVCCKVPLFEGSEKFDSGTGWPSFTQPITENVVAYIMDTSHGMTRVETVCNVCDAHLGHVFADGPKPSGLRYCINALAMEKIEQNQQKIVFGGGCFWCTEAIFVALKGVYSVKSGYSGGTVKNPTYREVCSGKTGHAEVIEIIYNPKIISFKDLIYIHLNTHNPTTLHRQGADEGTQYRSVIFYKNAKEKQWIEETIREMSTAFSDPIVTEITAFEQFYDAEEYHQQYYLENPEKAYCKSVIEPKLQKFKTLFKEKLQS